jgi:hypothetical protein
MTETRALLIPAIRQLAFITRQSVATTTMPALLTLAIRQRVAPMRRLLSMTVTLALLILATRQLAFITRQSVATTTMPALLTLAIRQRVAPMRR